MIVKLLHHSPLWLASHAIRMSHDNHDKSDTTNSDDNIGIKDKALIARVGNKLKHKSVLEQLVYWFDIDGISRACLQELARHRTARLTVKSSRYTLNELKSEEPFGIFREGHERSKKYVVYTSTPPNGIDTPTDFSIYQALKNLQICLNEGYPNDIVKYGLPEAFKTRLQWQIDMRNYQSFLELRLDKSALWEIRQLAYETYKVLPSEHKYLVNDIILSKGFEIC